MNIQHIFKQIDAHKTLFYAWFMSMHTRVDLAICNLSETESTTLTNTIYEEIKRIEKIGNRFDSESEISNINREAIHKPIRISDEMYSILSDCINFNEKTAGAFDITIQSKHNYRQGIQNIILNKADKTVFLGNENIQLDLCGYIKGYALDKIKIILSESNCSDALINMGNSSILALGHHPFGTGWKISFSNEKEKSIVLVNECLTSSGNTANHFHLINPQTGTYCESIQTKSVISENGIIGEVLSTALCVANESSVETICKNVGINKENFLD